MSTPTDDAHPARTRRARVSWTQIRAQWPLMLVLAGLLVALGFVMYERWRRGAFLMGAVAVGAAVLRAVLADEQAGVLGVRNKPFDTACYGVLGGLIVWLAVSVDSLGTG